MSIIPANNNNNNAPENQEIVIPHSATDLNMAKNLNHKITIPHSVTHLNFSQDSELKNKYILIKGQYEHTNLKIATSEVVKYLTKVSNDYLENGYSLNGPHTFQILKEYNKYTCVGTQSIYKL